MPEVTKKPDDKDTQPAAPHIVAPVTTESKPDEPQPTTVRSSETPRRAERERSNSGKREYIVIADWGSMPKAYAVGDRFTADDCPYSISEGLRKKAIRRVRPSDDGDEPEDDGE